MTRSMADETRLNEMIIREETMADIGAIRSVTQAAFAGKAYSNQTEGAIIDALRETGALTLSLVAAEDDEIMGHIAFSPVTIGGEDCGWFGLGPVSVRPDRQQSGIGSALVRDGLKRNERAGAGGCILVGDPTYYSRFGFKPDPRVHVSWVEPRFFQILALKEAVPEGEATFHAAFKQD